ncbi:MAG: 30S ribosomal protein S12 methylthiotransferase RimO [Deltaproteobacteria bacterium]|nr:30S ribosomal protein S12 methylthiotransferase RimO [Deltaproteobacteria bacterium]
MKNKVHITSLGCPKNLIDSEVMAAALVQGGFEIAPLPEDANIIIINTCAFILPAKEESIDEIFRMAELKTKGICRHLIVTGCLPQRYGAILEKEIPEVDLFLGTGEIPRIADLVASLLEKQPERRSFIGKPDFLMNSSHPRLLSTPPYTAYLKIAEGCSNHCSYCVIPLVRGKFRSRQMDDILREAETLAQGGVKEVIIAAQETTLYGRDLGYRSGLSSLLDEIALIDGIRWIRLLYTYPADLDDELFRTIHDVEKICDYIDIPVQHIDDNILSLMNRSGNSGFIKNAIASARKIIPGVALRTSLIVGFPGETQERFDRLLAFVRETRFDHVGVFEYSREEGTVADALPGHIPESVKKLRRGIIMEEQALISREINQALIGSTMEIVIEEESDLSGYEYIGRARRQAPDIDGITYVKAEEKAIGNIVKCRVVSADDYDLFAEEKMERNP